MEVNNAIMDYFSWQNQFRCIVWHITGEEEMDPKAFLPLKHLYWGRTRSLVEESSYATTHDTSS